eukprot:scaffold34878_cov101-Isochrysis_galbana.AAC.1
MMCVLPAAAAPITYTYGFMVCMRPSTSTRPRACVRQRCRVQALGGLGPHSWEERENPLFSITPFTRPTPKRTAPHSTAKESVVCGRESRPTQRQQAHARSVGCFAPPRALPRPSTRPLFSAPPPSQ